MAKCPKCSGEMEIATIGGVELDTCPSCRGIWFDSEELMQVLQLQVSSLSQIPFYDELQAREEGWDPPPAFCPRCSAALNPQRFEKAIPLIMDVCPNDHGLWLDQGELHSIKQFCDGLTKEPPEKDLTPEEREKMMERHRKSLRGFKIQYGVPEPSVANPFFYDPLYDPLYMHDLF